MKAFDNLFYKARFVLLSLTLYACADNSYHYKEPELEPYILRFVDQAAERNVYLDASQVGIEFTDKFESNVTVGMCITKKTMFFVSKDIQILKSYWKQANETQRWILIAHEAGHCFLGLDHKDDKQQTPHIMNAYMMDDRLYGVRFMDELFDDYFTQRPDLQVGSNGPESP